MKKIFTQIFLCLLVSSSAYSQIPNSSFENWTSYSYSGVPSGCFNPSFTGERPTGWQTSDSLSQCFLAGHTVVREGINKCDLLYAIKISSVSSPVASPGVATNGIITGPTAVSGGSPDTARSAQLSGCYKYSPVNGDTAYISAYLFKWNSTSSARDTIAKTKLQINGTSSAMTSFISNFTYLDWSRQPDTILVILQSSPALGSAQAGSTLIVDSLLLSGYVGIVENDFIRTIRIYPQPAQNELNVQITLNKEMEMTYEIADITGRKVLKGNIKSGAQSIDINALSRGNYFISLRNKENAILYSSKFIVSK